MAIRTATIDDIDTICRLAHEIWRVHYPPIIGEAQTAYMLDRMYGRETLARQIAQGEYAYSIWYENDVPIAFVAIDAQGKPYGFISKFYLLEAYRGKGIAQRLMRYVEEEFAKHGKPEMRLTVNRRNIGAINFYFKTGFKILRCEDFDIGQGYFMNDFVMGKKIEPGI